MARHTAERIAGFVHDIQFKTLPNTTVGAVKRFVLDSVGCALGAIGAEPVRLLEQLAPRVADDMPGAHCFGQDQRTTAEFAAAINGALVRYLDFMDVYWSRDVCHPAENIPVALACAEEIGANGQQFIEAVVAGYEVQLRLCDAFSFQDRGFHHVSAAGFVVPLVAGKLWRQSPTAMAHGSVIGGARHLTLGVLSKGRLSMAKAIGYPMAAAESITCARLAGSGFTGPLAAYEWLFEKTVGRLEQMETLALDTSTYRLEQVSLKQFPAQYGLQAPIAAAIRLHQAVRDRLNEITSIRVSVRQETVQRAADSDKFAPTNRETADHSLPSCVAMALVDGELSEAQFERERYLDPTVVQVTGLIKPIADEELEARFPTGRPGAVQVVFRDGTSVSALEEVPLGDRERPFTDDAVRDKFMSLVTEHIGIRSAERIVDFVGTLEMQPDLRPLFEFCRKSCL